jgi:hypothetical protein
VLEVDGSGERFGIRNLKKESDKREHMDQ